MDEYFHSDDSEGHPQQHVETADPGADAADTDNSFEWLSVRQTTTLC